MAFSPLIDPRLARYVFDHRLSWFPPEIAQVDRVRTLKLQAGADPDALVAHLPAHPAVIGPTGRTVEHHRRASNARVGTIAV